MVKKYIIMAGGEYKHWEKPRHLSIINGEEVIGRTIRLLKENGIKDISISTENPIFEKFNLPILKHENSYSAKWHNSEGDWCDCFYPTDEPVCYILGDVYFSEEAIKTIIDAETEDIDLFGSIPPFPDNYIKNHIEAFALKVKNVKHFKEALEKTKQLDKEGKFWRKPPIIWELWEVIKDNPIQKTKNDEFIYNYTKINDYTCDIDWKEDIKKLEKIVGEKNMIKCEVIERFTLGRFKELENIVRKDKNNYGELYVGDTFECSKDLADYLLGGNDKKKTVVKIVEIQPEKKVFVKADSMLEEAMEVEKPKKKKRTSKK